MNAEDDARQGVGWALLNVFQAIYTATWSAFWISAALIVLLVTFSRRWSLAMARRYWGPGLVRGAGATLVVEGADKIDPGRGYVFVSNHQSMIDIPVAF